MFPLYDIDRLATLLFPQLSSLPFPDTEVRGREIVICRYLRIAS